MRRLTGYIAAVVLLATAVPTVAAEKPSTASAGKLAGTYAAKRGCDHLHRSDVARNRIRGILYAQAPARRKKVGHYVACVKTKKKARAGRRVARQAYRWRKRNVCIPTGGNVGLGKCIVKIEHGWVGGEFGCLVVLWNAESGWSESAHNPSSGAHGIPQALPGSKMASHGANWASDPGTQIRWGADYIEGRYGTPCAALAFHRSNNWY